MAAITTAPAPSLVLITGADGISLIPAATPLTRLNYFDGKFLRADDLQAEQAYLRRLVELGNQAGGAGVVHGLGLSLSGGDQMTVSAGLAIDPAGRVLLLPQAQVLSISGLIAASQGLAAAGAATASGAAAFAPCAEPPADTATPTPTSTWYLITAAHAEALCGEEDVYGALCEQACVTTTDRPYRIEGILLRAHPLLLSTPLPACSAVSLSVAHLRSRLASAYFADEAAGLGDRMSAAHLKSAVWCAGAAAEGGYEVPLGVLVREGASTRFIDQWTARRERIDPPPKRYWQWRIMMRPWDVFLAQILQFQCQLRDALQGQSGSGDPQDPCNRAQDLVAQAADAFEAVTVLYRESATRLAEENADLAIRAATTPGKATLALADLEKLQARLKLAQAAFQILPRERQLIHWGIVELPSAGYLPVVPGDTTSVNRQIRRLVGEGLDLRFCIVRPDFVAHALEEAQHLERISLLDGLDHPDRKPAVDVLVPNGQIAPGRDETGRYYEMRVNLIPDNFRPAAVSAALGQRLAGLGTALKRNTLSTDAARVNAMAVGSGLFARDGETYKLEGAARGETLPGGGLAFHYGGLSGSFELEPPKALTVEHASVDTSLPTHTRAATAAPSTGATAEPRAATSGPTIGREQLAASLGPQDFWLADQTRIKGLRASLWVSVSLAGDPTTLTRGTQTGATGEAYLLVVRPAQTGEDGSVSEATELLIKALFDGDLRVDRVAAQGAGSQTLQVDGELTGELSVTLRIGDQAEVVGLALSEPVTLLRTAGAYGLDWEITLASPPSLGPLVTGIETTREWTSAEEAEVKTTVDFEVPTGDLMAASQAAAPGKIHNRQLYRAWQTINGQVAEPAHPAHERAIRAIQSIGSALGQSRFADLKASLLFPPPTTRDTDLTVLGTLDWVLFHRRRDKTCQEDVPSAPVQTRTYALYQLTLGSPGEIDRLQKAMAANDTQLLQRLAPDYLQVVEYAAGIQSLLTSHPQVRATWRQDVGAAAGPIAGGVIASGGMAVAEGEALALERLTALAEVIRPESGLVPAPDFEALVRVPDYFAGARQDGAILLLTVPTEVETACHRVYWLTPVPDKDLQAQLAAGDLAGLPGIDGWVPPVTDVVEPVVEPLGTLHFEGEATEPRPGADADQVVEAWKSAGHACAPVSVLSYRRSDASDGGDALIDKRSHAIATLLGNSDLPVQIIGAAAIPGDCPVVTLVRPLAVCLQTHVLDGNLQEILIQLQEGLIHDLIAGPNSTRVGDLTLCPVSRQVFGGEITALNPTAPVVGIWYAIQPGYTAITPDQTAALIKADLVPQLGPDADAQDIVQIDVPAGIGWPNNCPLLAFVVLRRVG